MATNNDEDDENAGSTQVAPSLVAPVATQAPQTQGPYAGWNFQTSGVFAPAGQTVGASTAPTRTFQQLIHDPAFLSSAYAIRKEMFDNWKKADAAQLLSQLSEKERAQHLTKAQSEFDRLVPKPQESGWLNAPTYVGLAGEGLAGGLAAVGDVISPNNDVSSAIRSGGQWLGNATISDAAKDRQLENQQRLAKAEGFTGKGGEVLRDIWNNPLERLSSAVGSAAPMVAAGAATGGVGAAALGAAMNAGDVRYHRYQQAQAISDADLQNNPRTAQLLAGGWTPAQVRDYLANDVGAAELVAGVAGAVPGGFFGRLGGNLAGAEARGVLSRLGASMEGRIGTGIEGALAGGIGAGGAQAGRNIADQTQGRNVDTFHDVFPSALAAGIPGGFIGAGLHSRRVTEQARGERLGSAEIAAREQNASVMDAAATQAYADAQTALETSKDPTTARQVFEQRMQELVPKNANGELAHPYMADEIARLSDNYVEMAHREHADNIARDRAYAEAMGQPVDALVGKAPLRVPGETFAEWVNRVAPVDDMNLKATTAIADMWKAAEGRRNDFAKQLADFTARKRTGGDAIGPEGTGTVVDSVGDSGIAPRANTAELGAAIDTVGTPGSAASDRAAPTTEQLRSISAGATDADGQPLNTRAGTDAGINRNTNQLQAPADTAAGISNVLAFGAAGDAASATIRPSPQARGRRATDQGTAGERSVTRPADARVSPDEFAAVKAQSQQALAKNPGDVNAYETALRVAERMSRQDMRGDESQFAAFRRHFGELWPSSEQTREQVAAYDAAETRLVEGPGAKPKEVAENLGTPREARQTIDTLNSSLSPEAHTAIMDNFQQLRPGEKSEVLKWAAENGMADQPATAVAAVSAAKTMNAPLWKRMSTSLKTIFNKVMRGVMVAVAYFSLTHAPVPHIDVASARPLVAVEQSIKTNISKGEVQIPVQPVTEQRSKTPQLDNMYENRVNQWVQETGDNRNAPYVIVNKGSTAEKGALGGEPNMKIVAPDGTVLATTKVLTGRVVGDTTTLGQTPAGKFTARQTNIADPIYGGDVRAFAGDGKNLFAIHRVITTQPSEQRMTRLNSQKADDTRISLGCINVPVEFYNQHFAGQPDMRVYVIPDRVQAMDEFGGLKAPLPPERPADLGAHVPGEVNPGEPGPRTEVVPSPENLIDAARATVGPEEFARLTQGEETGTPGRPDIPTDTPTLPGQQAPATAPRKREARRRGRISPNAEPVLSVAREAPVSTFAALRTAKSGDAALTAPEAGYAPRPEDLPRARVSLPEKVADNNITRQALQSLKRVRSISETGRPGLIASHSEAVSLFDTGKMPNRLDQKTRTKADNFITNFHNGMHLFEQSVQHRNDVLDPLRTGINAGNDHVSHLNENVTNKIWPRATKLAKEMGTTGEGVVQMLGQYLLARQTEASNSQLIKRQRDIIAEARQRSAEADKTLAEHAPPDPSKFSDPAQHEAAMESWRDSSGDAIVKAQREKADAERDAQTAQKRIDQINKVLNKVRTSPEDKAVPLAGNRSNAEAAQIIDRVSKLPKDFMDIADALHTEVQKAREYGFKHGLFSAEDMHNFAENPLWVPTGGRSNSEAGVMPGYQGPKDSMSKVREFERNGRTSDPDDVVMQMLNWSADTYRKGALTPFIDKMSQHGGEHGYKVVSRGAPGEGYEFRRSVKNPDYDPRKMVAENGQQVENPNYDPRETITERGKIINPDNPDAIQALTGANRIGKTNDLLNNIAKYTQKFGFGVTRAQLMFAPVNGFKDVIERAVNIGGQRPENVSTWKLAAKAAKDYAVAAPAIARYLMSNGKQGVDNPWVQRYLAARDQGAVLTRSRSLRFGGDERLQDIAKTEGWRGKSKQIGDFIHNWNEAFEAAAQTTIKHNLEAAGFSPEKASAMTLRAMDLNQRGLYSAWGNALYPFFSTRLVGGSNVLKTMSTPKGMRDFGAMVGASMLLYEMSRQLAGTDDPEVGNKTDALGNTATERGIPVWLGKDTYFKIPIPYGVPFGAWNLGSGLMKQLHGKQSMSDTIERAAVAFIDELSPLGTPPPADPRQHPAYFGLSMVTPEIAKRALNVAGGVTSFGSPLNKANLNAAVPRSMQGKASTSELWKNLASGIQQYTGADATPEEWREGLSTFIPFLQQMSSDVDKLGAPGAANSIIGAGRLWATPKSQLNNVFYDRLNDAQQAERAIVAQYGKVPDAAAAGTRDAIERARMYAQQHNLSENDTRAMIALAQFNSESRRKGVDQETAKRNFLRSFPQ